MEEKNTMHSHRPERRNVARKIKQYRLILVIVAIILLIALVGWLIYKTASKGAVASRSTNGQVAENFERQLPELRSEARRNSDDPEAHKRYAVALFATGDAKGAKEQYEQAIKLNDKDAIAHNNLGNAQRQLKEYDDAIASYKKSLELDPNALNPYLNASNIQLFSKNSPKDAIATLQEGLKHIPDNKQLLQQLAVAYENDNNKTEAIAIYERLLAKDPEDGVAKIGLERLKK